MAKSGYAPGGKSSMGPSAGMSPQQPFSLAGVRGSGGRVDPALFAQMLARQRMGQQGGGGGGGGQQMMHWGAPGQQGGGGMQNGLAQYAMQQQMQKAAQQAAMLRAQQPVAPPPQQQQPQYGQPQDYHMSF